MATLAGDCATSITQKGRAMSETRKLAAILAADVVGYSRLAGARSKARARLAIKPTFSISRFRVSEPSDSPTAVAGRERIIDGLRKAGVPEQ
jgi:hypothetical protein